MIRRDYLLGMIEQFMQALARINSLKKDQRWEEAALTVEEEFKRFIGAGPQALGEFTETELLARLIQGEPTPAVRDKTLMLTGLIKEAGDLAAGQDRAEESRAYYLKGLHLLLETLARGEVFEFPDFVPKVEVFVDALQHSPLPLETYARLMQHYERTEEFAKAEDALFAMLDAEPTSADIIEFGIGFYERLRGKSDACLMAGNLPRSEVEAGLSELRQRKFADSSRSRP